MFHDLLALLKECVLLSTTSMVASNASFVHMPLLVVEGNQFNCGADLLLCGSRVGGRFSFFDARSISYERLCNSWLFFFSWSQPPATWWSAFWPHQWYA
jgi:hypothetical protein